MKTTIHKQSFPLGNVSYRSDYSNNLSGRNVTTEVDDRRITLSIDVSHNEEKGKDDHNSVIDVRQLLLEFESVDFVQLNRERWLDQGLEAAFESAEKPALLWLEFRFKGGETRKSPALLQSDRTAHWFYLYH